MLKLSSIEPTPGETCGWTDGRVNCGHVAIEALVWRSGDWVTDPIHTCSGHAAGALNIMLQSKQDIEDAIRSVPQQ